MRFVRKAFFARHKHDKQFAELGEQQRRTEMIVILMEVLGCVVLRSSCISNRISDFNETYTSWGESTSVQRLFLSLELD